jgi:hypothetical protein
LYLQEAFLAIIFAQEAGENREEQGQLCINYGVGA